MNKKLTEKQIKYFKTLFLKQKEDIVAFLMKNHQSSDIDLEGDEIDIIQANILHTIDKKIVERETVKLNKIEAAISKIENETFGNCEECDDLISIKRLEAIPQAELCIFCAEKAELETKKFLSKKL